MDNYNDNENVININSISESPNINEIPEKNEYQKMSEYLNKIKEYKNNNYKNCIFKQSFCDCLINGDWIVGYVVEKDDTGIIVINISQFYEYNNSYKHQMSYSDGVAYFRKYTKPKTNNIIPQRENKKNLTQRIKNLLDKKDLFKEEKKEDPKTIYEYYYFLHSIVYKSIDFAICRSKDKSSGVEEGFKIIIIILEILSEFYHYIKDNFGEFLYYKNNIVGSELEDLVLFNKKYAIFSFWDDANLLMNKIFLNNINYLDWFIESEKVLLKVVPSSPNVKKISSNEKLLYPLYDTQIPLFKIQNYNYKLRTGYNLQLKRICIDDAYKDSTYVFNGYKYHTFILSYLIDYFYSLGGYNALFSLCKDNDNIKIATDIFNNILYACTLTNNFRGIYEAERNGINLSIFKFLDSITMDTLKTYKKSEIIDFLQKGSKLYPNITDNSTFFFEDIYIRYILKILTLRKKINKKLESLNDLNNILTGIEYNQLLNKYNNEKNEINSKKINELNNNSKYDNRDKLIKEINYHSFCLNCKNYKIIELLLKDKNNIHEEILITFAPILFVMYKNNFGYRVIESTEEEVKNTKKLIFETILNKLKEDEKENINIFSQILQIINDFCEIFTDEDKFYFFSEIKLLFYDSIFNQKITFQEIFNFLIKYTSIAVKTTNIYRTPYKEKNIKDINAIDTEEEIVEDINSLSFNEHKYYGLELIYSYLSYDTYKQLEMTINIQKDFINIASKGVVTIISSIKDPKLAVNIILNKICNSIKKQNKDTLPNLLLLLRFLNYSIIDNFYTEFNQIFNEYLKRVEIIIILIDDLFSFLEKRRINKKEDITDINNINEINTNIINSENENIIEDEKFGIKSRIKTIFAALLQYNNATFDYNKIEDFFIKLIKYNEFCKDTLFEYLLKNINNLSIDFLMYLFSKIISNKDIFQINNDTTYQICKNIIFQINKKNNYLYLLNNKDLVAILNKSSINIDIELMGVNLLWDLLLNNEQKIDDNIINDLIDLFCTLFIRMRIRTFSDFNQAYEEYWTNVINNISEKLKILSEEKNKNVKGIKCLILLIKKIIDKSNNDNDEIIKDISEIEKESINFINNNKNQPKEYSFIGNKIGIDNCYSLDLKINNGDLFYILRYKISYYYSIPVNQVVISAYFNDIKSGKKITQKEIQKLHKNKPLKEYNYLNDFENIYDDFNKLFDFNNKTKKPLLLEVKSIKNHMTFNPVNIIYNNSKLSFILMNLLKESEAPYTFDILCLIKGNNIDNKSNLIMNEIEKVIRNNQNDINLFNFENTSIYYISYIIFNLNCVIQNNKNDHKFIDIFLKSYIWNKSIKNLNIINEDYKLNSNSNNNKGLPLLGELYEQYNLINNLVSIYLCSTEHLREDDINQILYKIIEMYNYIINKNININLNQCGKSQGVSIGDIKQLCNKSIININKSIIKNKIIFNHIINSIINNNQNNEEMNKIKNAFEYIIFESILKNKNTIINKNIKSLIFDILNKFKSNNNRNVKEIFYNYLYNLYLTEKSFEKIASILKDINESSVNINTFIYDKNAKILFDIIIEVLMTIYEYIKDKLDINYFVNKIILPKIYNIYIPNIPIQSIFHQLFLGGMCKLLNILLFIDNNNNNNIYNMIIENNKKIIEYLYDEIIMSKCKENILTPENINYENNSLTITSKFCLKEATNLFIILLFRSNNYENICNNYVKQLTSFHKLCYWKGNSLSDWKLYYKENKKSTSFVGLKNLGCTCYINSLLQIFYNIPLLRESLLNCECSTSTEKNCFYQLKKVFYSLKYLQTSYYTPNSFVENYDNEELNVRVQMDAFEFFCGFLDKIEEKLKNTENQDIIKYFFMGRQNDVLTFEGNCKHHRTNESPFYSIQLQVQGKNNIYESLNSLIEGEKMQGDNCIYCPQCNEKLPAIKSQNFKTLPRIIMFVLKRFEFNNQNLQKTKINDYYEFPLILDMNKYTEDFINNNKNEDNQYKLKSIVVHTGTCESGHYYSFILDEKSNEWYEFNDTRVEKFNIKNLDTEAYGKKDIINDNGNMIEVENNRNAYMVFYEKINKNNCEKFDKIEVINELLSGTKNKNNIFNNKNKKNDNKENKDNNDFNLLSDDNNDNINSININEINTETNNNNFQDILIPINKEMFKYFLSQKLFSGEYHHFILSLFINMLNKYINKEKVVFSEELCCNRNSNIAKEIIDFKKDRKIPELSNIENYVSKKKIYIINSNEQYSNINNVETNEISKEDENKILELFKNLIIYFFNVMIRAREKDYLGGTVDLIKYLINNYLFCANYLIEEYTNYNFIAEYLINCPSYDIKKLVVGILFCAMLHSIKSYEDKMRKEKENQNNQSENNDNNKQKQSNNDKENDVKENSEEEKKKKEQEMSDEELARRLQAEFNGEYNPYVNNNNINNDNNDSENPLKRKYIPENVLKIIYNMFNTIQKIKFNNKNESRFLYYIIYRFSLVSKKTRKLLLNKALVLEFLNILLSEGIKDNEVEYYSDSTIIRSMNKGFYTTNHAILNTDKGEVPAIYDKGGAFHYENYLHLLYFYLLSYNQKPNSKNPFLEGNFNFDNKKFIKSLFFKINTKQDAYVFSYLIWIKCTSKNYKKRIEQILYNIINILARADNNEKINYDVNNNKDNYNGGIYSDYNNNTINNEDFPRINPKYLLLIFKRFITKSSNNKKIDDYRINLCLSQLFKIIDKSSKYYNFTIMIIDFIIELYTNYFYVMKDYMNPQALKSLIQWLNNHPISPELYPIEGLVMYKDDNVAYKDNVTEEEKTEFKNEQMKKTENRILKLNNIIEKKIKDYDYDYEADFDLTDFKFRKGDIIYYNKNKAIIKEFLDELILIKIIDEDNNDIKNNEKINKVNNVKDNDITSINDLEKIKFWVSKDDKNISIYDLE